MNFTLETHGFAIVPNFAGVREVDGWKALLGPAEGAGRRGLLAEPAVAEFARSRRILDVVSPWLPGKPRAVRAIYFDKSAGTNWLVPWHQDLTIAVGHRAELPGYGPWSIKENIHHVQPPAEFLENMLTVRLHLDDTDESNGALRVLPGSHQSGKLTPGRIAEQRMRGSEVVCRVAQGGVLLMRPLLLHASGRSVLTGHRRVLHLEFAGAPLPNGLQWHEAA